MKMKLKLKIYKKLKITPSATLATQNSSFKIQYVKHIEIYHDYYLIKHVLKEIVFSSAYIFILSVKKTTTKRNTNTLVLGNIATEGFERFKSSEGHCNGNDIIIVKINRRNRNWKNKIHQGTTIFE